MTAKEKAALAAQEAAKAAASKFTAEEIASAKNKMPEALSRGFEGRAKIEVGDSFVFDIDEWETMSFSGNEYWGANTEVLNEDGDSKGIMTVSLGGLCRIATALDGTKVGEDNELIALSGTTNSKELWDFLCENHMEDSLVCTKVQTVETDFGPQRVRHFNIA